LGCSDNTLVKVIDSKPEIMVHPTELFFGHVRSGYETEQENFSIINVGNAPLHVDPSLIDGSTRFDIPEFQTDELVLQPGEILDVPVDYAPITYEHNGAVVRVLSTDEEEPEIIVIMEGYGDAPVIDIDPEIVDYGNISIGCDNEYRVTITNTGNLGLEITDVVQMTTLPNDILMEYGSLPDPPWSLLPTEQLDFLIKYIPLDIGEDESEVSIQSNDPKRPEAIITQVGKGDIEHWIVEEWLQEETLKMDIIWVIDNSGSMGVFQSSLSSNMTNFMNQFLTHMPDFRMGFITTDRSYFQGATYIDNNSQNPASEAASIINSIGVNGSSMEKGLATSLDALLSHDISTNFLRSDAMLVLIYVSDEADHSPFDYQFYINNFNTIKQEELISAYAVVGDYPSGCTYQGPNSWPRVADFGAGYYELAMHYGGEAYSICAIDWGQQMNALANQLTTMQFFQFAKPDPIESTIEVYINGQQVTEGWTYESSFNGVAFNDDTIPISGQTIRIEYATYGCG